MYFREIGTLLIRSMQWVVSYNIEGSISRKKLSCGVYVFEEIIYIQEK